MSAHAAAQGDFSVGSHVPASPMAPALLRRLDISQFTYLGLYVYFFYFLAERCNFVAMSDYCHNNVVCRLSVCRLSVCRL